MHPSQAAVLLFSLDCVCCIGNVGHGRKRSWALVTVMRILHLDLKKNVFFVAVL